MTTTCAEHECLFFTCCRQSNIEPTDASPASLSILLACVSNRTRDHTTFHASLTTTSALRTTLPCAVPTRLRLTQVTRETGLRKPGLPGRDQIHMPP
jgi:hypothetical protein